MRKGWNSQLFTTFFFLVFRTFTTFHGLEKVIFNNFSQLFKTGKNPAYLFIYSSMLHFFQLFLYSVISLLNMLSPGRSLSVRLCVCLSVTAFYLNTIGPISMKLGPHALKKNLRWHISQILEMLPQWRHNGYFDVLRWGTLTPSIFMQFSSIWHMLLFNSLLCMGLQSSVFGSYLLSEMTVGKTVKNQSDVKLKTTFLLL